MEQKNRHIDFGGATIAHRATKGLIIAFLGWALFNVNPAFGQWIQPYDTVANYTTEGQRLGIFTFRNQNSVFGQESFGKKNKVNYSVLNNNLYNSSINENLGFVQRDIIGAVVNRYTLKPYLKAVQFINFEEYLANQTRLLHLGTLLSSEFKLNSKTRLSGFSGGGYVEDSRSINTDRGSFYLFEATMSHLNPKIGFNVDLSTRFIERFISPRNSSEFLAKSYISKDFAGQAGMDFGLGINRRNTEDYLLGNIQRIVSDTFSAYFGTYYRLNKKWVFRSANDLKLPNRKFEFRRNNTDPTISNRQNLLFNQQNLDTKQSISYRSPKIRFTETFSFQSRNRVYSLENNLGLQPSEFTFQQNQEKVKDIYERITEWLTEILIIASKSQSFSLETTARLLRVDTPSEVNTQDRDEVIYGGQIRWNSNWKTNFRTFVALEGSYKRFVFIEAEQSIENFTERIIRLEPGFNWTTRVISWKGSAYVWSTYQVRDFLEVQDKNRANRILFFKHELEARINPTTRLTIDYQRRENRLSVIDWQAFTESPLDTTIINDGSVMGLRTLKWPKKSATTIGIGYRLFLQNRYSTSGLSQGGTNRNILLNEVVLQQGPKLMAEIRAGSKFMFNLTTWLQFSDAYNLYKLRDGVFSGPSISAERLSGGDKGIYPYITFMLIYKPKG